MTTTHGTPNPRTTPGLSTASLASPPMQAAAIDDKPFLRERFLLVLGRTAGFAGRGLLARTG